MFPVSRTIDRYETTFDHDGLIADAGLIVVAALMSRLGLERLAISWVLRSDRGLRRMARLRRQAGADDRRRRSDHSGQPFVAVDRIREH